MFGPKRKGMAGDWRRLHTEDHLNKCTVPDIIRVIKLRRMVWADM
jgi:hypothetical protein